MSGRDRVGVGIIGAGFLAEHRARCYGQLSGLGRIVAVAARSAESAGAYAAKHGVGASFDDYRELLEHPEVDVVDLCVPNLSHRPIAEAAAAAGKHIICTKPLTAYVGQDLPDGAADDEIAARDPSVMRRVALTDARAMTDAATAAGVQLMYAENWVYAPSIVRAFDLVVASGGSVVEMRGWEGHNGSHSPDSKVWRYTGGGALLRLGAHPVGAMLALKAHEGDARNGRPIRAVSVTAEVADLSRVSSLGPANNFLATGWQDVENWGCVVIRFEDGSRGVAYGSDNMLGGMESRLEILASNHHLKCNLSPHDLLRAYAPSDEVFGDEYLMEKVDQKAGWSTPLPDEMWAAGHVAMCEDFLRAVVDGRPARSDGELGVAVIDLIYAAYVSAADGRRVDLAQA